MEKPRYFHWNEDKMRKGQLQHMGMPRQLVAYKATFGTQFLSCMFLLSTIITDATCYAGNKYMKWNATIADDGRSTGGKRCWSIFYIRLYTIKR